MLIKGATGPPLTMYWGRLGNMPRYNNSTGLSSNSASLWNHKQRKSKATHRVGTWQIHFHHCLLFNSLRPRPNRRHFADDIFKCIFDNENEWISPRISLKFVPQVRINNIPALVQIMAWRRPGDKPLSEPMMARLPTHICVTQPQWVISLRPIYAYALVN